MIRLLAGVLLATFVTSARADEPAWFGAMLAEATLSDVEVAALPFDAAGAVRLETVVAGGPASRSGFLAGDLLLRADGELLGADAKAAHAQLLALLSARSAGDSLRVGFLRRELRWTRAGETVAGAPDLEALAAGLTAGESKSVAVAVALVWHEETLTLGQRPEASGAPVPKDLYAGYPTDEVGFATELREAVTAAGFDEDTADLEARLARLAESADGSRSHLASLVQREPLRLGVMGAAIGDQLAPLGDTHFTKITADLPGVLGSITDWGAPAVVDWGPELPPKQAGIEAHLDWMQARLERCAALVETALADVDADTRSHVADSWTDIGEQFCEHIYLYLDEDKARLGRNLATIAAGERVDRAALLAATAAFQPLLDRDYIDDLKEMLYIAKRDLDAEEVISRSTPLGRIVIGGRGDDRHRRGQQGADLAATDMIALFLDLGGDDYYADGIGTTVNQAGHARIPASFLIDLEGDDAYEATQEGSIGAGVLGVGVVIDGSGNDRYIGTRWSQGVGFMGLGLVVDGEGDDRYLVEALGQGIGAWGAGIVLDHYGDDRYAASRYAQGVGLAGGLGLLSDRWGSDEYLCKGRWPSGYGTAGVFQSWGQGCGVGFRGNASGGLGFLFDGAGGDRYEAGNFSQGGGYYFGVGALWDRGVSDDVYIGSRYNQGFAAHQAVGYFEEAGGSDEYWTRNAVAPGLAWDECVTSFSDLGGDDLYQGGSFSLAASAHNAISLFHDAAGLDEYRWADLAHAGGNDYHGGTSLSWFLDEGGAEDLYAAEDLNDSESSGPENRLFLDR